MSDLSYRYRAHPFARSREYRLGDDALIVSDGVREQAICYADFNFIESFTVRFLGSTRRVGRRVFHPSGGRPITLSAAFRDRWRLTDRSADYERFIKGLHARVSPDVEFVQRRLWLNRANGLGGKVTVALMRAVGRINPDRWAAVAAWIMRRVGPRLPGHRRALQQLALAFPDKSRAEHERIAVGMWDNLARTVVEYSQLSTLWQQGAGHPERSRIIRTPASTKIWENIRTANRPTLHFSLHSGNWELAAIAGVGYVRCLIPYRRMKNAQLTDELVRLRTVAGTTPVPAGPSMVARLRREFGPGDGLGMLIDQRYAAGIEVQFFGRPTLLNPLFARIARIYDCPIYGSRVIRRPDRRFDYEIVPVEPKRDARGRIDVAATTQSLASIMEGWVREHPEQWMWLHRIWR